MWQNKREEYYNKWKEKNREKFLAYQREYAKNKREAKKIYDKEYYEKNREVISEKMKEYRENNREIIKEQQKIRTARFQEKHKDRLILKNKKGNLKRRYGITIGDYLEIAKDQEYRCLICKMDFSQHFENLRNDPYRTKRELVVDHCHSTNVVRGLLCGNCNRGLGGFRDNPQFLLNAAKYILSQKQSCDVDAQWEENYYQSLYLH